MSTRRKPENRTVGETEYSHTNEDSIAICIYEGTVFNGVFLFLAILFILVLKL